MLIAQLTDLHVRPPGLPAYRVVETNMLTERALAAVERFSPRPDVVLITGDLTDCGLIAEYEALRDILERRLTIPVLMVPGNHDRRTEMRQVFGSRIFGREGEFVQGIVDDHPVRLIGLDTVVPGYGHGALCGDRLAFLRQALADGGDKPTLIFMHHPPFVCGIAHIDRIRLLEGADALRAIVAEHPNVERLICGHHHRPIQARFGGTIASISPSVAHQVELDLTETESDYGALTLEPPAFQLHRYRPETGLVSHTCYIDAFPGPFPFVLDQDYPGRS